MTNASDYPSQVLVPHKHPGLILWIFSGEFALIDNFAETPVGIDVGFGFRAYQTSEHAFAAAKAIRRYDHDRVWRAPTPGRAKALGRRIELREDWEDVKYQVMWDILQAKFSHNANCREVLRSTGDRLIYEGNTWGDRVWGVTRESFRSSRWVGQNALGEMLMKIRERLGGAKYVPPKKRAT